jgi:hypothetical protein
VLQLLLPLLALLLASLLTNRQDTLVKLLLRLCSVFLYSK